MKRRTKSTIKQSVKNKSINQTNKQKNNKQTFPEIDSYLSLFGNYLKVSRSLLEVFIGQFIYVWRTNMSHLVVQSVPPEIQVLFIFTPLLFLIFQPPVTANYYFSSNMYVLGELLCQGSLKLKRQSYACHLVYNKALLSNCGLQFIKFNLSLFLI